MKKNIGFTLIELLAVIVILAIILAIAVPGISSVVKNSAMKAFENDAKLILNAIKLKMLEDSDFNPIIIDKTNVYDILGISDVNYESLTVTMNNETPYIEVLGTEKWDGLTAYGNLTDLKVISDKQWAVSFDGSNDYISIPNGNGYINGDFTLEMIIKPEYNNTTNPRWFSLIDGTNNLQVGQMNSTNKIYFRIESSSVQTQVSYGSWGEWLHVVFVRKNGLRSIYVNGQLVNIETDGITANATFSAIGAGFNSITASPFKGIIAEVCLRNTALSADEVAFKYGESLNVNTRNIVIYYQLGEGKGTETRDYVNNRDGVLTNGPKWIEVPHPKKW